MKNTIEKALQRQKAEREKQQKEKQEESPRFGHDSAVETQESESTKKVSRDEPLPNKAEEILFTTN